MRAGASGVGSGRTECALASEDTLPLGEWGGNGRGKCLMKQMAGVRSLSSSMAMSWQLRLAFLRPEKEASVCAPRKVPASYEHFEEEEDAVPFDGPVVAVVVARSSCRRRKGTRGQRKLRAGPKGREGREGWWGRKTEGRGGKEA